MLQSKITPYQERAVIRYPSVDSKIIDVLADIDPDIDVFLDYINALEKLARDEYGSASARENMKAIKKYLAMAVNSLNAMMDVVKVEKGKKIKLHAFRKIAGFLLDVATSVYGDDLQEGAISATETPSSVIETILEIMRTFTVLIGAQPDEPDGDFSFRIKRIEKMQTEFDKACSEALQLSDE